MTAGQDALREAARLESALVYGGVRGTVEGPRSVSAIEAEATLVRRVERIDEGVRFGMSNPQLVQAYGASMSEILAARLRVAKK